MGRSVVAQLHGVRAVLARMAGREDEAERHLAAIEEIPVTRPWGAYFALTLELNDVDRYLQRKDVVAARRAVDRVRALLEKVEREADARDPVVQDFRGRVEAREEWVRAAEPR